MRAGSVGTDLMLAQSLDADDLRTRKATPDSFLGTGLQAWLRAAAVDHLVICGHASEFCVDTTVRRAAALGNAVMRVADAHTAHDKPHAKAAAIRAHENATLPEITRFGACIQVLPGADVRFA